MHLLKNRLFAVSILCLFIIASLLLAGTASPLQIRLCRQPASARPSPTRDDLTRRARQPTVHVTSVSSCMTAMQAAPRLERPLRWTTFWSQTEYSRYNSTSATSLTAQHSG